MTIKPGLYIHHKGKYYEVLYTAHHSETLEELVIYKALYKNNYGKDSIWARPKKMFDENVKKEKKNVKRFKFLGQLKPLKFNPLLIKRVIKGEKTSTWRLFDDKNLKKGDYLQLLHSETKERFALAVIKEVKETTFRNFSNKDLLGHETYASRQLMLDTYSKYYSRKVTENTKVKIIKFELLQ